MNAGTTLLVITLEIANVILLQNGDIFPRWPTVRWPITNHVTALDSSSACQVAVKAEVQTLRSLPEAEVKAVREQQKVHY